MSDMRRRDFIALLGGAAAAVAARWWRAAAGGPSCGQSDFLGASTPSAWSQWTTAFVQRLRELGWTRRDGQSPSNIAGRRDEANATQPISQPSSSGSMWMSIVTVGKRSGGRKASNLYDFRLCFAIAVDPVGSGMVASLARNRAANRHRHLGAVSRTRRQSASKSCAKRSPQHAAIGDHRRCWLCRLGTRDIRGSGRSTWILGLMSKCSK